VQPATAAAGGSAYTLTLTGTGFDASAQVTWNGSPRTTTYVSPTKVLAQVSAADIAAVGNFPVAVYNVDGGSVSSNTVSVSVTNMPLALTILTPASVSAGGPAYMQTVTGTGFGPASIVQWNGSARPTTFVSTTQLQAAISAADIAAIGSAAIKVVNGGATPATSSTLTLSILKPSGDAVAYQINPQHNGAVNFANIVAPSAFPLSPTWTAHLDGTPGYALVAGGRVFATVQPTSGSAELVALSAATGAVVWGPIALSGNAYATYDNGRVIVQTSTIGSAGILTAYDAGTGTQLWSTALTTQYMFEAAPTALNGIVYVSASGEGGTLYAVDDTSGALLWTAAVENGDWSSPTVSGDGVYVSYPCQTYDFSPVSGALVWHNSTGCEGGGGATGTLANGVYYSPNGVAGFSGMAFDAETGALHGSYSAGWPPAIGAGAGFFIAGGSLQAINNTTNVIQWTFAGDGALSGPPILVNNYVFVASSSGKLYAVDAGSGAMLWQTDMGGNVFGSSYLPTSGLSAGDGMLLVPTSSGMTAYTLSNNP
jgi:outer membrane protein assembly factor BamB